MVDPVAPAPPAQAPAGQPHPSARPAAGSPASDVVARVQEVLERTRSRPVDEHVAAYDEVHALLQQELSRLDEG